MQTQTKMQFYGSTAHIIAKILLEIFYGNFKHILLGGIFLRNSAHDKQLTATLITGRVNDYGIFLKMRGALYKA